MSKELIEAKAIASLRDLVTEMETWEPDLVAAFRETPQAKLLREWINQPRTSHLPDREEVLQEVVDELRMVAVMNCEGNADFLDGIMHAISRILSLMERKA